MAEVAFAGAGGVGYTGSALLRSLGHGATLWAPVGETIEDVLSGKPITISGALNGTYDVKGVESAKALAASADVIYLAVSAFYQKQIVDELLPHLTDSHTVLCVGANLGGGGLYLSKRLAAAGKRTKVAVMNGPMIAGRRTGPTECATAPYRGSVLISALPHTETDDIIATLEPIYGKRYRKPASGNSLEVAMAALNGVIHVTKALVNITRIEDGLPWDDYRYATESWSNLAEAADVDRIAVGKAFGFDLLGGARWFDPSGKAKTMQEATQPTMYHRTFKPGPRNIDKARYIEEELPYSLYVVEELGKKAGVKTPMISDLITIMNATRGKDYRAMHTMADDTGLRTLDVQQTLDLWKDGYRA